MDIGSLKRKTFVGIIWKFAERFLAQGISLLVSIVLARLLSPQDYAPISVVAIFFAFANIMISGGLNTSLMQKKDADILDYSSVLSFSFIVSVILYFLLYILAPSIADLYKQPILIKVFRIMGLILIVNAVKSVICAYISSNLLFRKFFFSTLGGTLFSAVLGIVLAVKGFGVWALVVQQMSNSIVDTVILYLSTRIKFITVFSPERLKTLFKFGSKMLLASFVSTLYDEVSPLVIGLKYSPSDLALYEKGRSFPSLINSAFNDSVSAVIFPAMAKVQDDSERVLSFTRRFMKLSSFLVFPFMIGFFCVSDQFVIHILTEKWIGAVPYIKIFCICFMFNIIQNGNLQAIKAIGKSDIVLKLEVIKKSLYFIILIVAIIISKSPMWIALVSIINTVIATIVNTHPNTKLIGYSYRMQILDLFPNLSCSLLMGVMVYLVRVLFREPTVSVFILQIIVGVVSYIFLSVITKNDNIAYLLGFLKNTLTQKEE